MLRISHRQHITNFHEANKHIVKSILGADGLFIPKGNYNTYHTQLPMHICKLIQHHNRIHKQNSFFYDGIVVEFAFSFNVLV